MCVLHIQATGTLITRFTYTPDGVRIDQSLKCTACTARGGTHPTLRDPTTTAACTCTQLQASPVVSTGSRPTLARGQCRRVTSLPRWLAMQTCSLLHSSRSCSPHVLLCMCACHSRKPRGQQHLRLLCIPPHPNTSQCCVKDGPGMRCQWCASLFPPTAPLSPPPDPATPR
jgi:hypothetical protein